MMPSANQPTPSPRRSRRRQAEDLIRSLLSPLARTDLCVVDPYFGAKAGVARSADLLWRLASDEPVLRTRRVVPGRAYPLRLGRPETTLWLANARDLARLRWKLPWLSRATSKHIAYWYFELDRIPAHEIEDALGAGSLDEIWVASQFVAQSVRRSCSLPVAVVPPPVLFDAENVPGFDRANRRADRFYLSLDAYSSVERKNPWIAVEAFQKVFKGQSNKSLTLRVSRPEGLSAELRERLLALRSPQITVRLETFERGEDARRFMAEHDVYLSPHRSEGLGLHLVEAILLGMPVIATGYGGNVDFCDPDGVDLIDHDLVAGHDPQGLYKGEFRWAEPRLGSLCGHLEAIGKRSAEENAARVERARQTVVEHFATDRILATLLDRLGDGEPGSRSANS